MKLQNVSFPEVSQIFLDMAGRFMKHEQNKFFV